MKRFIQAVAGLGISGGALALTLRGKNLGTIWAEMLHADYRWLWPYVALAYVLVRVSRAEPQNRIGP